MSDHFQAFDIKQLSVSAINKWQAAPASFVASYIFKLWDNEGGPALWRGTAVEAGLNAFHLGKGKEFQLGAMLTAFENEAKGESDDGGPIDKAREALPEYLEQAINGWSEHNIGKVLTTQVRREAMIDGCGIKLMGFADYRIEAGYCVDLKTTDKIPSEASLNYKMQAGFYAKCAGEDRAGILYASRKKSAYFLMDQQEIDDSVKHLYSAAKAIDRTLLAAYSRALLEGGDPKNAIAEMVYPDPSSFYWSNKAYLERCFAEIAAWRA